MGAALEGGRAASKRRRLSGVEVVGCDLPGRHTERRRAVSEERAGRTATWPMNGMSMCVCGSMPPCGSDARAETRPSPALGVAGRPQHRDDEQAGRVHHLRARGQLDVRLHSQDLAALYLRRDKGPRCGAVESAVVKPGALQALTAQQG